MKTYIEFRVEILANKLYTALLPENYRYTIELFAQATLSDIGDFVDVCTNSTNIEKSPRDS